MEFMEDAFEEYSLDTKNRFLEIIKKEQNNQALTTGEVAMLFFWQHHKTEPRFTFLKDYIKEPKKKI